MIFSLLLLVVSLACLWFFIKTLIAMARTNILWAIGGFFISPLVQIIYYLMHGQNISAGDKQSFIRFFITYGLVILFAILMGMTAPATMGLMPQ